MSNEEDEAITNDVLILVIIHYQHYLTNMNTAILVLVGMLTQKSQINTMARKCT